MPQVLRLAAFTKDPTGGCPAGVVLAEELIPFRDMQNISADIGYPQTAFVTPNGNDGYRVRYFSPITETAPSGRGTICAAVALAQQDAGLNRVTFHTNMREQTVAIHRCPDGVSASVNFPSTRSRPVPRSVLREALACFDWDDTVLECDMPPAEAFGDVLHLVLPVRSQDDLHRASYDLDRLRELMWIRSWMAVDLVWRQHGTLYLARTALAIGGVEEDPALRAAAFGGYLRDHGLISAGGGFTIHQDHEFGTSSTIFARAPKEMRSVRVHGWAVPIGFLEKGPTPPKQTHWSGGDQSLDVC